MKKILCFLVFTVVGITGCVRSQIHSPKEAMRAGPQPQAIHDDLPLATLLKGLKANVQFLKASTAHKPFVFGPRTVTRDKYILALEHLIEQIEKDPTGRAFYQSLKNNFEFFEVYGKEEWGEAFITSYYEPVIEGRRQQDGRFTQPLYSVPEDMVVVDMGEFADRFAHWSVFSDAAVEQKSRSSVLRGRLIPKEESPSGLARVVPYFDRREIDELQQLKGKDLEMVYVDPIDAFFLQIQGSGTIQMPSGQEFKVGYAAQNGHPYVPIGKFLFDVIPREEMSLQRIEQHMRQLSETERQELMNKNPSYVFFQKLKKEPLTYMGTEVVEGRTIATDYSFFPKGALAFLEFEKPIFADEASIEPVRWEKVSRFVIDQDTGGAIRGPHRVDLFWGRGAKAEQAAGVMKNWGRLSYLVPRQSWLDSLGPTQSLVQRGPESQTSSSDRSEQSAE